MVLLSGSSCITRCPSCLNWLGVICWLLIFTQIDSFQYPPTATRKAFASFSLKNTPIIDLNKSHKLHHSMNINDDDNNGDDLMTFNDLKNALPDERSPAMKHGYTRRALFSRTSPALAMALAVLGNEPLHATANIGINAAEAMRPSDANAAGVGSSTSFNTLSVPFSSVREQELITLSNGLEVLLVNDKLASQSTAALVVDGAGQFTDSEDLPGLAHLMEHMVLSSNSNSDSTFGRNKGDLEEWLGENGGASNAFTAYHQTCFHFNCPHITLPRALKRFSCMFEEANIIQVCKNSQIIAREVRRVDSELDLDSMYAHMEYVTKAFVNSEHPYSRNGRGNLESLETNAQANGVNVGQQLTDFFRKRYLPTRSVLVVVSNQQDLVSMRRWIQPFAASLSTLTRPSSATRGNLGQSQNQRESAYINNDVEENHYPGRFLRGRRKKHVVLYDNSLPAGKEKLTIQWVLNEDYRGSRKNNAVEIAFVLNQILGRRGPGSLYLHLRRQGWIQNGLTVPLQVKVPMNVSGFQILKFELSLTLDGFLNRSRVVAAVYDYIDALRYPASGSFLIPRDIMAQYATTAKLFGYYLAPRPPDAVELAIDSTSYDIREIKSGKWYRFPSTEELGGLGLNRMRRAVSSTFSSMSDPEDALIIVTAGTSAIAMTRSPPSKFPIPPLASSKWRKESFSGAQIYFEDMLLSRSRPGQYILTNTVGSKEDFLPPVYNPFELTSLRQPRPSNQIQRTPLLRKNDASWTRNSWRVLMPGKGKMPLPRSPPESNLRCAFVLQLLSSRPTRATAEQAANGELWKLAFDALATDLAELGAPGGLAYELRFNNYGLRISFLGLSKTMPSYARRIVQLLVKHQQYLFNGPRFLPKSVTTSAVNDANRARGLSPARKRIIIDTMQKTTAYDVGLEGAAFLNSCMGAVCLSEGDFGPFETESLLGDLQKILSETIENETDGTDTFVAVPTTDDLIDIPSWKPRNATPCYIAGVSLMSDACGRTPR